MKAAIETREVITVGAGGELRLRGTYHKPHEAKFDSRPESDEENTIGILFVSAGVSPRAAPGDSAVYWSDSLAKLDYRSFRFDLPGLGDSDGDLSAKEIDFDSLVNEGAFGPVVSGMADQLVERFHLRGVVIIGHCAGAVTALYAAAANNRIKGIVLLDPYFHVQQESAVQNVLVRSQLRIVREIVGDRPEPSILREAAVKLLSCIRNIYHRLEHIRRFVRRKRLPSAANLPLIRCWSQLATSGLPMLVLGSPLSTPKPGEFDYVRDLQPLSDRNCRISVRLIERATHSFSERHSKEAVLKYAEQWLSASFSPTTCAETRNAEYRSPELAAAISGIDKHVH